MSAILSADDLNDFISPGVACIKPVETLPKEGPSASANPYEVTTEDKVSAEIPPPAQISLTDCLACSGCVTSAEAVLVSLQSHAEVLNALDSTPSLAPEWLAPRTINGATDDGRIFIASVSPQTRASIAATYGVSVREAGYMAEQLLSGPRGIGNGGKHGSRFAWVVDTSIAREICLVLGAEEVIESLSGTEGVVSDSVEGAANIRPRKPILTSSCPGWICYAEKTHPHILPHLSRLKSPQALLGTLLKTSLSSSLRISPEKIWHVAVMPCFDKKLEASREELTDEYWNDKGEEGKRIRDVDCVITTKELLMLADSRGITFSDLPRTPLSPADQIAFPDATLHKFLFPKSRPRNNPEGGTSGGYLYHILQTFQARHPGSSIRMERGRNTDVAEFTIIHGGNVLLKTARYYGFRNIQNLVRKLKPPKQSRLPGRRLGGTSRKPGSATAQAPAAVSTPEHAYIEVMACPGGCTNGGGQIKVTDVLERKAQNSSPPIEAIPTGPSAQKEWLSQVDEAYFSDSSGEEKEPTTTLDPIPIQKLLTHWSTITNISIAKLAYTTYRKVESDVGKDRVGDTQRVVELAGKIGGGW
ncbi:MAG: Cytosolic Fe-S cluster assembly factor nar1 [Geoglossum umbratile]|nr:MAG: Cytosolic Fe-S cluster assembly factor nar1 [Geoglossum umbratile]